MQRGMESGQMKRRREKLKVTEYIFTVCVSLVMCSHRSERLNADSASQFGADSFDREC